MRNKDFAVLAQRLLPDLPGFAIKAPLMFISPVGYTLRGLYFESHSYETNLFYVWVFFLPLFIPRKHVSFEFGKRIGGDHWNADAPDLIRQLGDALKREALPFLSPIKSPRDVAQAAMALRLPQNPHIQQAIAYAFARAGEVSAALRALHELIRLLDGESSVATRDGRESRDLDRQASCESRRRSTTARNLGSRDGQKPQFRLLSLKPDS